MPAVTGRQSFLAGVKFARAGLFFAREKIRPVARRAVDRAARRVIQQDRRFVRAGDVSSDEKQPRFERRRRIEINEIPDRRAGNRHDDRAARRGGERRWVD